MCNLELFKINLKALKQDETPLQWELDDRFFQQLEGAQLQCGSLHVSGSIRKAVGFFELQLHTVGTVEVTCDRCLDLMAQPISAENQLTVKLGSTDSEEDDTIVVSEDEGILDCAWLVYETIALAIPIQHVHAPGKCNPAMTQVLEELSADRSGDEASSQAVDPRWEKLKNLKM